MQYVNLGTAHSETAIHRCTHERWGAHSVTILMLILVIIVDVAGVKKRPLLGA